ncbi:MAG TPA: hypothetical protein VMW50_02170, partial [Dehalococcoidia bacterium]|nr:hypothetical protein [Dehalococcoidia bacterium]
LSSKTGIMGAEIKRQEREIQNRKTLSQLIDDNRGSIQKETFAMLEMVDAENSVNDEHERNIQALRESQADLIASTSAQDDATDSVRNSLNVKKEMKEQQSQLAELQKLAAQEEQQSLADLETANVRIVKALKEANQELQQSVLSGKKQTIEFEAKLEFGDTDKAKELAQIKLMSEYYKDITGLQHELAKATMSSAEAKEYDAKLNYGDALGKQRAEIQKNVDVTKSLHKAIQDFQRTSMSEMDKIKLDVELELGDAGAGVAQIKILTKVNEALVNSQNDLAKATMTVAQAKEYDLSLQYGTEYGKLLSQIDQTKNAITELTKSTQEFSTASLSAKDARVANLQLEYPEYLAKELALSEQITSARKDLTNAML